VNDRLSRGRAEHLRTRLVSHRPNLRGRTRAAGVGAREPLVGTGADNASDALDRWVEFGPLLCANLDSAAEAVNSRAGSGAPGRAPL
jgi:hypothetical protein